MTIKIYSNTYLTKGSNMADLKELAGKMKVDIENSKKDVNKHQTPSKKKPIEPKTIGAKRRTWLETPSEESIVMLATEEITNWSFHDRPENELGDIDSLAKDFLSVGQQQPCVVRPTPIGSKEKYELIIGERRWRAAIKADIELKVIIKELSDSEAALAQAAENDNRQDLSDYAKGIYYDKLIESGIIKQSDIVERLNKSRQYVSALLSFSKIPEDILNVIGDLTKVSARTAETIKRLAAKGDRYIEAIISKADKIRSGKLGANKLAELVETTLNEEKRSKKEAKKIIIDGWYVASLRPRDNNNLPSVHFPKTFVDHLNKIGISIDGQFSEDLGKFLVSYMSKANLSARADKDEEKN